MKGDSLWDKWGGTIVLTGIAVCMYAADARWGSSDSANSAVVADQVNDLHEWHSLTDEDGVKIWYVPRSYERAMRELTNAIRAETAMLDKMSDNFVRLAEEVEELGK